MSNHPAARSLGDIWLTVKLLAQAEPSFTEAAIRNHVFNASPRHTSQESIPGNGLAPYIRRVGAKVLINHGGFLSWIEGQHNVGPMPGRAIQGADLPSGKYGKQTPIALDGKEVAATGEASQIEPFPSDIPEIDTPRIRKQRSRRRI